MKGTPPCSAVAQGRAVQDRSGLRWVLVIDIYFDTFASTAEHAEVDQWCAAHDGVGIEYVSIDQAAVFVHGCTRRFEAIAGRVGRHGTLADDLSAALVVMQRARGF